jgi:hypothetical protein
VDPLRPGFEEWYRREHDALVHPLPTGNVVLVYGYLPRGARAVEVSGPGVDGVAGFFADGSTEVWAVGVRADQSNFDEIEVVYRFSDGHTERAPRP